MELLLLLSLAGIGAAFMAFTPDGGDGGTAPDDDSDDNSDDKPQTDNDDDNTGFIGGSDRDDSLDAKDNQTARGFAGNDTLAAIDYATAYGDTGNDDLTLDDNASGYGGDGNDTLTGTDTTRLSGGAGDDTLAAEDRSTALGDEGDDRLDISDQATGFGGAGDDRLALIDSATAYGGAGNDTLSAANGAHGARLSGDDGNDVLTHSSAESGDEDPELYGGAGDDTLFSAYDGQNYEPMYYPDAARFFGGEGNDLIQISAGGTAFGGAGDDTIVGFAGSTLSGNAGSDLFVARSYGDAVPYIYDSSTPEPFDLVPLPDQTVTIADFTKGEDRLNVDFNGASPVSVDLADNGTDTSVTAVFDLVTGETVTSTVLIRNVTGLTLDDIIFGNGAGVTASAVNGQTLYAFTPGTRATLP